MSTVSCVERLPSCADNSDANGASTTARASADGQATGSCFAGDVSAAGMEDLAVASAALGSNETGDSIAGSGRGSCRGGSSIGSGGTFFGSGDSCCGGGRQSNGGERGCAGAVHSPAAVATPAVGAAPDPESGALTGEAVETVMSLYSTADTWSTPGGVSAISIANVPGLGVMGEADAACRSRGSGAAPESEP